MHIKHNRVQCCLLVGCSEVDCLYFRAVLAGVIFRKCNVLVLNSAQALCQCPAVSLKPMQQLVQLLQQFFLCGMDLFFDCDFRCFATGVILALLIHNFPLEINHFSFCTVLGRDWAREVLAQNILHTCTLCFLCHMYWFSQGHPD